MRLDSIICVDVLEPWLLDHLFLAIELMHLEEWFGIRRCITAVPNFPSSMDSVYS